MDNFDIHLELSVQHIPSLVDIGNCLCTEPLKQIKKSNRITYIIGRHVIRSTFVSLDEWSIHSCMCCLCVLGTHRLLNVLSFNILNSFKIYFLNEKHNRQTIVSCAIPLPPARAIHRTEIKCVVK